MILLLLLAVALIGIALTLALRAALGGIGRKQEVLAQVASYGFGSSRTAQREPNALQTREIASEIGERLIDRMRADQVRELRQLLNSAGYYQTTVTQYLGYRALSAIGLPLVVRHPVPPRRQHRIGWTPLHDRRCGAGTHSCRRRSSSGRHQERTARIDYEVPELVDLLVTTIEAGVGFGSALQITSRRVREPLGSELRLTLGEQSMGLTMSEALKNMLERTNRSVSMRAFVQVDRSGRDDGRLDRQDAPRPCRRHAQAAPPAGRGAGAEGADQAALPADVPDSAGDDDRHPRPCRPGSLARARRRLTADIR